ncbi:MmcB family DNA repair protein [Ahrensia kielensis]|uniref:MmcB family DNA repair protein n=1 Tax=Ahrensia kielensis TaxID=76980 RepID=A0ABU9TAI2_9HYPH|nr:MmcB family DNA repair protein [Ahrensia kielensis]
MPIISPHKTNPLIDGRQSDRALAVRRGVQKLLSQMGAAHVPELTLANGRRADLAAIFRDGTIWIIEIKSSAEDIKSDHKWPDYFDYCDQLFFATLDDVPQSLFPNDAGFMLADARGAAIIEDCPVQKLNAARRKAITLRFAQFAAKRLHLAELAGYNVVPEQN